MTQVSILEIRATAKQAREEIGRLRAGIVGLKRELAGLHGSAGLGGGGYRGGVTAAPNGLVSDRPLTQYQAGRLGIMDQRRQDQLAVAQQRMQMQQIQQLHRQNVREARDLERRAYRERMDEMRSHREQLAKTRDGWMRLRSAAMDFGHIMGATSRTITFGLAAMTVGVTRLTNSIINQTAQFQQWKALMGSLSGSQQLGNERFEQVRKRAIVSPLTMNETVEGATSLLHAQHAWKDIIRPKTGILDIYTKLSATSGKPMNQVMEALESVRSGTWLQRRLTPLRLTKQKVQGWGVDWDQDRNRPAMLDTDPEGFYNFIMSKLFEELKDMNPENWLRTKATNIRDRIETILARVGEGGLPGLERLLDVINNVLDRIAQAAEDPAIQEAFGRVFDNIADGAEGAIKLIEQVVDYLEENPDALVDAVDKLGEGLKVLVALAAGLGVGGAFAGFLQVLSSLVMALGTGAGAVGLIALLGLAAFTFGKVKKSLDELLPSGESTTEMFGGLNTSLDGVTGGIERLLLALDDLAVNTGFKDWWDANGPHVLNGAQMALDTLAGMYAYVNGYRPGRDETLADVGVRYNEDLKKRNRQTKVTRTEISVTDARSLPDLLRKIPHGTAIEAKYPGVDDKVSCVVRTREGLILLADGTPEAQSLINGFTASIRTTSPVLDQYLQQTKAPGPGDIIVNSKKSHMGIIARIDEKGNIYGLGNSGEIDSFNFGNLNKGNFTAWDVPWGPGNQVSAPRELGFIGPQLPAGFNKARGIADWIKSSWQGKFWVDYERSGALPDDDEARMAALQQDVDIWKGAQDHLKEFVDTLSDTVDRLKEISGKLGEARDDFRLAWAKALGHDRRADIMQAQFYMRDLQKKYGEEQALLASGNVDPEKLAQLRLERAGIATGALNFAAGLRGNENAADIVRALLSDIEPYIAGLDNDLLNSQQTIEQMQMDAASQLNTAGIELQLASDGLKAAAQVLAAAAGKDVAAQVQGRLAGLKYGPGMFGGIRGTGQRVLQRSRFVGPVQGNNPFALGAYAYTDEDGVRRDADGYSLDIGSPGNAGAG